MSTSTHKATQLITLRQALRLVPRGGRKQLHLSTIYRWCSKGTRHGVKLRILLVGGTRFTTAEWLAEFFERATEAAGLVGQSPPPRSPSNRHRSHRAANDRLAASGW